MKKKTTYLWIVLILSAVGVVLGLLGIIQDLINFKILFGYGTFNSPVINIFKFILEIIGFFIAIKFVFKLYNITPDLIHWTDIYFGYGVIKAILIFVIGFFAPGGVLLILLLIPAIIMIGIYIVIWLTFKKHLVKAQIVKSMDFS